MLTIRSVLKILLATFREVMTRCPWYHMFTRDGLLNWFSPDLGFRQVARPFWPAVVSLSTREPANTSKLVLLTARYVSNRPCHSGQTQLPRSRDLTKRQSLRL